MIRPEIQPTGPSHTDLLIKNSGLKNRCFSPGILIIDDYKKTPTQRL
jgi:hypothetical protein